MSASVFPPIRMPHRTCKLCTCLSLFLSVLYYALLLGLHRDSAICVFSPPPRGIFLKLFHLMLFPLYKKFEICFPSNSSNSCANWNVESICASRFFFPSLFCATLFLTRIVRHLCNQSCGLWKEFPLKLFDLNVHENNIWSFGLYR